MEDSTENFKVIRNLVVRTRKNFENSDEWTVTRRLMRLDGSPRSKDTDGYLDILPRYNGQDLVQILETKIGQNGRASLIDIGCGAGFALLDLREIFPVEKLSIVGIGNRTDTEKFLRDVPRKICGYQSTKEALQKAEIEFIHSNFIDLFRILGSRNFDVLTGVFSLLWIDYPSLSLFKKAWRMLKNGGVGFIAPFEIDLEMPKRETRSALEYLRKQYGFKIQLDKGGVAFEKTQEDIPNIFQQSLTNPTKVSLK